MPLLHSQKGKLRLAFQLRRPRSLWPSACLSHDTRILAPRFSSSTTITPRWSQTCAGLSGRARGSLRSGQGYSPRAPAGRRGDSWPHGGGAGVERGWAPRRTAIGRGPRVGGGPRLSLDAPPMGAAPSAGSRAAQNCRRSPG